MIRVSAWTSGSSTQLDPVPPTRRIPAPHRLLALAAAFVLASGLVGCRETPGAAAPSVEGAQVFADNCAVCHTLPILSSMFEQNRGRPPGFVFDALTHGNMRRMGAGLDVAERRAVAEFFTGVRFDSSAGQRDFRISPDCDAEHRRFDWRDLAYPSWGGSPRNHRRVPGQAAFGRQEVGRLAVDWVVAFPESSQLRSHPTAAGGALFVGSHNGSVYALDQATGCTRWHFKAATEVRSAVTIHVDGESVADTRAATAAEGASSADRARPVVRAIFADRAANLYAVDAESGALLWKQQVDPHLNAAVTGSVSAHDGLLFVPISSNDDINALDPTFPCCTHHGAVVAVDAKTGAIRWTTPTVTETPEMTGRSELGAPIWGPSGASVWNTPTIDVANGLLFVGSGNNHSRPATAMSDSVLAMDIQTGQVRWTYQSVSGDAWNAACIYGVGTSCPAPEGPDTDFGSTTVLGEIAGRPGLFAGQKSGWLHALDPETGGLIWKKRIAYGGAEAGIRYGMALLGDTLYVPGTHQAGREEGAAAGQPGVVAISARDGSVVWQASGADLCRRILSGDGDAVGSVGEDCDGAVTAPTLVTEEVVFAAGLDGVVFALDRGTGRILWHFDTAREFTTLTGHTTRGGGIAGTAGPMYANGRLFVSSGYGQAQRPGNALIAFSID